MSVLVDLGQFLAAEGHGTLGTNIFIEFMGDAPDELLALYRSNVAEPAGETFGEDTLPVYDTARVQLRARAGRNDNPTAEANVNAAWKSLVKIANEDVNGRRFLRVRKLNGPLFIGVDRGDDRPQYAVNLHCTFEP